MHLFTGAYFLILEVLRLLQGACLLMVAAEAFVVVLMSGVVLLLRILGVLLRPFDVSIFFSRKNYTKYDMIFLDVVFTQYPCMFVVYCISFSELGCASMRVAFR